MSYTGNFPKFNKVSADGKEVYFGDPNTDGSYRLVESAGSIHLEERVAGVWTDLGDIVGGGGGGGAVYNVIADDNVDFDATVNYIEISADKTLGSKNVGDGKTTMLVVKNTDSSDHSLNFDSTVGTSATDDATAVKANSQNSVYILQGVNGGAVSGLLNNDIGNTFPAGSDGDLTITSGNTVQLNAGDVKDYNKLYFNRKDNKVITAIVEEPTLNMEIIAINYTGFQTNICDSVEAYQKQTNKTLDCNKSDNRYNIFITNGELSDIWPEFTSKLRITE